MSWSVGLLAETRGGKSRLGEKPTQPMWFGKIWENIFILTPFPMNWEGTGRKSIRCFEFDTVENSLYL
jgi:hypothetical protein